MIVSAILVGIISTMSQWWVSHTITRTWLYPIWSGFLVALAMGQPIEGMQAAAFIQLTYLGWITAGGTMPGNLMVAGVFGTALTLLSGADPQLAPTFAVPFALLGILINQAYMTLNAFWVHRADRLLDQGRIRQMRMMNYVPSGALALLLYGLPAFAMVLFGKEFATTALESLPEPVIASLQVVGALMPALGISMLLSYLGKKKLIAFFLVGYFATVYLQLDTMSITVFAVAAGLIVYYFTGQNKTRSTTERSLR